MASITLDTSQVDALAADISRNAARVPRVAEDVVARTAYGTVALAQQNAPVDTGNLRSSIGADIDGLTMVVGPTAFYGDYVEQGTHGPYEIPDAFGWGITVMHPGNTPSPYLGPAADVEFPRAVSALGQLASQILRET